MLGAFDVRQRDSGHFDVGDNSPAFVGRSWSGENLTVRRHLYSRAAEVIR